VLYFMATGHPPFRAEGTMAVLHRVCRDRHRAVWQANKNIPDGLSEIIDRLLEKKPSRRPASAADVQHELAALLSRWQQQGPGRREFSKLRLRRPFGRAIVAAGVTALLGGAIVGAIRFSSRPESPVKSASALPGRTESANALQLGNDFYVDMSEVERSLLRMQENPFYLRPARDAWKDELRSLDEELSELESSRLFTRY
jgi:serine/threonine protein kinase